MNHLWSMEEECILANVWLSASECLDLRVERSFWNAVTTRFNNQTNGEHRTKDRLMYQWKKINQECLRYNAIYKELTIINRERHELCSKKTTNKIPTGYGAGLEEHLAPIERPDKIPMGIEVFCDYSANVKRSFYLSKFEKINGNLVLLELGQPIWQSFDHPTDTLLPYQPFTKSTQLVSSRSPSNYSSGFYRLFFDYDCILRLLCDVRESTSLYWPDPNLLLYEVGRYQYNDEQIAILDSNGEFNSSDGFKLVSADYGTFRQRIMKIDTDGNLRLYSLVQHENGMKWEIQWQAVSHSCKIHGTCGPNSLCSYSSKNFRKCRCLHGYKMVNSEDWSYGCEPEFKPCTQNECGFIQLHNTDFYGYDIQLHKNRTVASCKKDCLQDSTCTGFLYSWKNDLLRFSCFTKSSLQNGYRMGVEHSVFLKVPQSLVPSYNDKFTSQSRFICPRQVVTPIIRSYDDKHDHKQLELVLAFGCVFGFVEIICIVSFWYCTSKHSSITEQNFQPVSTGFRKFTYSELKKASHNFSEEIGKGSACVVYKGRLSDNRIAAIKRLKNTNNQGEAEFQAEVSTIGRVNHMNLIEMWGYCAEGKHRLIVYEYMENGSLANNLGIGKLDWATRFNIARGTAKGLAYLHEECLEWVLHCDVKPHNILLDANYIPKVADFGLSKQLDRCDSDQWNFSMMRGTRGYMAPEWVLNHPITSKVDVFSYGVVMLEMVTGRSPTHMHQEDNGTCKTEHGLINWVTDKIHEFDGSLTESWVDKIVDPSISNEYDRSTMENLVKIALQCAEEDREVRPSMSQVVDMLIDL
ncbi:Apple-like protein [Artemisia annua]|uniref:non-specific serine/threonine protein kinase n=1 Tax=Artemisia annua TaxID=35608 RepID=A0A2U1N3I9_ARTAN|nr:Apple-like protein [Artemisia annua]